MVSRLVQLFVICVLWTGCAQALAFEPTAARTVGLVLITEGVIYVTASADGWGTTCSPSPFYVYFNRTAPNAREMLAGILAAKAAGQQIYFVGTCSVSGYFLSTYLVVL